MQPQEEQEEERTEEEEEKYNESMYVHWTEPQVVRTNREAKIDKAKTEKLISARQEYYSNG